MLKVQIIMDEKKINTAGRYDLKKVEIGEIRRFQ
jgi:hypothetical protein